MPLAAGRWPLAAGRWPLAAGRWQIIHAGTLGRCQASIRLFGRSAGPRRRCVAAFVDAAASEENGRKGRADGGLSRSLKLHRLSPYPLPVERTGEIVSGIV